MDLIPLTPTRPHTNTSVFWKERNLEAKNHGHVWHLTFKQSLRYVLYPARSPITVEDHRISAAICIYMTNLSNFKPGNHIAISGKEIGHASLFFFLIFTLCFHIRRTLVKGDTSFCYWLINKNICLPRIRIKVTFVEDIFECLIRHDVRFPIIGDNLDSKDNDNNNKRIMDPWVIHSNLWLSTTRYPLLSPSLSFESRLDFNGLYIPVCEYYTVQSAIKHEACMACRTNDLSA